MLSFEEKKTADSFFKKVNKCQYFAKKIFFQVQNVKQSFNQIELEGLVPQSWNFSTKKIYMLWKKNLENENFEVAAPILNCDF